MLLWMCWIVLVVVRMSCMGLRKGNLPRAPTTLKAERATVVNCILTLKILISK
jgi:hypothetical protein